MSADDFQTKYASVMESMMKSAVAETTKLFETMVDELKAEISTIKKENEDLKTRCSQFENAKSRPITAHTGESELPPGPRDGSEKRDTAVQCDLVPLRNVLVEQCQRARHQEQQCNYGLQNDHDYGEGNSPMPLVKKEIQEEVEPRQGLSDHADSPQTSACGTETEGLLINQICSKGSMTLPQKDEETRVAMEPPCMGMDSNLQGAQKQSSELEYSQVISLAAVTYDMEEKSDVGLKISEIRTQGKLITSAEQPAHQRSEFEPHKEEQPSMSETSNEQMHVAVQQSTGVHSTEEQLAEPVPLNKEVAYDKLKCGSTEGEASSKPGSVCRRRGRLPKKAGHLQQPVKEICKPPSTDVLTEQEVLQAVQQYTGVHSTAEQLAEPILLNKEVACDKLKSVLTEGEASSKPGSVCRKRGRPSKKTKHLQQAVKETSKSSSTDVQTDQEVPQAVQQSTGVHSTVEQLAGPIPPNKEVAYEESKSFSTEGEASSKPGSVCSRRGRPPKKAKSLQPPVKEIPKPPSTDVQTDQEVQKSTCVHSTEEQLAEPIPPKKEIAYEELKSVSTEGEASSKPGSVCRRRGRPPKKTKHLQNPVKEILKSPMTVVVTDQEVLQAPSTHVLPANETLNTPPAESVQAPSVQHRERRSSVTLQDAILLVEAMNQSTVKNTCSTSQRMAPPQIQCTPRVVTLQTVDELPAQLPVPGSPPQTPLLPVVTHDVAVDLHVAELSTTTQSTVETTCDASQTTDDIESSKAQGHIMVLIPQQPHSVTLSRTNTSSSSSTAGSQTIVSLKKHPSHSWIAAVNPNNPLGSTVLNKIIVVPRAASSIVTQKIAALSPTQLSTVVSAVAASQKNSSFPASTAAGLPLGILSLSSISPKTIFVASTKSQPVVTSMTTTSSTHQQSATLPKITILIPKSAVATSKQETLVQTTKPEAAEPDPTVNVSLPLLISSSQQISNAIDTQTALDLEATTSSVGLVPITVSPEAPLTAQQNLSPVVKLSRLPFPISTNESVLISRLLLNGSSDGNMPEEPSSVVKSTQSSTKTISEMPAISTDICPNLKETSVTVSVCDSQMSEEPNDIQEKASLSSGTCTILDGAPVNGSVQPSTPSKVSTPVSKKSTIAVNMTESSAVSGTASDPTSNMDEEIINNAVQDCVLPNDPPIQETESATFIQLTSITPKDKADPHLQMTKTQFLAQLAVSPVVQAPKEASTSDFADARASCAETSVGDKRKLRKNSLVARLRSHLKIHLQAKRTGTNPELLKETETTPVSIKKPKVEIVGQEEGSTLTEPIPVSPNPAEEDDVTSLNNTANDPTSISPRRSGLCEDGVRQRRTVSEPSSVSSRAKLSKNSPDPKKATSESTPVSPRRSSVDRDCVNTENTKSTPGRSRSIKVGASPKKTKFPRVSPRRSCSTKDGASTKKIKTTSESPMRCSSAKANSSPKKTQSTSLSPRRTNSTRDWATPKNTKSTSVSPKRCSSIRDSASPKTTKSTSTSPRRSRSAREDASPKTTKPTSVRPRKLSLTKNDTSPKMSTSESSPVSLRRYSFNKDGSSTKRIKRESNSFSPMRYSNITDGGEISTQSARWPKLAKDSASPRKIGESIPAKRPRLIQDSKKSLRLVNTKKLSKAAKAKTLAKIKTSKKSILQNGAKTRHLAKIGSGCEALKRIKSTGVWIPPIIPVSSLTSLEGKRSSLSPAPKSPAELYPPSVSRHPIPVKAPPMVSPLQPLSVIGGRLLKNQCGECGCVFTSSVALESHVSLHTGHRPFSCTLCGKRFADSKGLKRHDRVHRNGRIHVCQQCGKGFVYRFGLTKHVQMVHRRIKPFVCQICNKAFFTKRDVENHIRIHTGEKPFKCTLCERNFARRVELNVHLRWHNGEKRHWCTYCTKGFLDLNNLKRHLYTHTGEKPQACPHCPKHFKQSGHLKKHITNVHKL